VIFVLYLFALFLLIAGIVLLINPGIILGMIEENTGRLGLYAAAILVRLGLGIIMILMAGLSRFPLTVTIIGWIAILAAVVFLLMGKQRFQKMMDSILVKMKPWGRAGGIASLAFGGFLLYAFV